MRKSRPASSFGKEHCLCEVLNPLIRLCQFFGVLPVTLDSSTCKIEHTWLSGPVLVNVIWSLVNLSSIIAAIVSAYFIGDLLRGTSEVDIIAFALVLCLEFICTTLIFLFGNYTAIHFCKGWEILHQATEEIAMPNFRAVRHLFYYVPLYMLQDFILNMSIYFWITLVETTQVLGPSLTVVVPIVTVFSNVVPNLVSSIFSVVLACTRKNFEEVNRKLEQLFEEKPRNNNFNKELIRLKHLHEKLCEALRNFEKTFGLQILAGTCVGFVVGIYAIIIGTQLSDTTVLNRIGVGFGITSIAAAARILVVIISCQRITNEANGTSQILNQVDLRKLKGETRTLVVNFLGKLARSRIQIRCCDIFRLECSFLAPAASNVVTYVLILLQFRMEKDGNHFIPEQFGWYRNNSLINVSK